MAAVTADKFKQLAFVRQVKEVLKALDKPESGASTLQAFLECHDPSEPATSDLLKDEKSAEVIRSSVMLDVLVECLDPERKAPHPLHVLGLLRCLALIDGYEEEMYASDTVTRLLDLLLARPDWDLLQASALKLIANLTQDDVVREAIGQEDALLEHLAKLLERPGVGVDVAMRVCLVLANTAVDSLENKERIGLETTPQVLQLLRAHPRNASVAKAALYLIHNLATQSTPEVVADLIEHQVVDVVAALIPAHQGAEGEDGTVEVVLLALDTLLGVLHESHKAKKSAGKSTVRALLGVLSDGRLGPEVLLPALIALLQLAKLKVHRHAVAEAEGVRDVVRILEREGQDVEVADMATKLLDRLCCSPQCLAQLELERDLPVLLGLLQEHPEPTSIHFSLDRLFYRLTTAEPQAEHARRVLKAAGGISALVTSMNNHPGATKKFACEAMNALFLASAPDEEEAHPQSDEEEAHQGSPRSRSPSPSPSSSPEGSPRTPPAASPRQEEEEGSPRSQGEPEEAGLRPQRIQFADSDEEGEEGEEGEEEEEDQSHSRSPSRSRSRSRSRSWSRSRSRSRSPSPPRSRSRSPSPSPSRSRSPSPPRSRSPSPAPTEQSAEVVESPTKDDESIVAWALKQAQEKRPRRQKAPGKGLVVAEQTPEEVAATMRAMAEKRAERVKEEGKHAWASSVDEQYHQMAAKAEQRRQEERKEEERRAQQKALEEQRLARERAERELQEAEERARIQREEARMAKLRDLEEKRKPAQGDRDTSSSAPLVPPSAPKPEPKAPFRAPGTPAPKAPPAAEAPSGEAVVPEWQRRLLARKGTVGPGAAPVPVPSPVSPAPITLSGRTVATIASTSTSTRRLTPTPTPATPPPAPTPTPVSASPDPTSSGLPLDQVPAPTSPRSSPAPKSAAAAAKASMARSASRKGVSQGSPLPRTPSGTLQGSSVPRTPSGTLTQPSPLPRTPSGNIRRTPSTPISLSTPPPASSPVPADSPAEGGAIPRRVSWRKTAGAPPAAPASAAAASPAHASASPAPGEVKRPGTPTRPVRPPADAAPAGGEATLPAWKQKLLSKKTETAPPATTPAPPAAPPTSSAPVAGVKSVMAMWKGMDGAKK